MAQIEPAFMPLIPICRELPTPAGYLDNLWVTPAGAIVLGECKLYRNPQARREVVAQALDYARAIAGWHFEDLQAAVRKALNRPQTSLWELVQEHSDLDESQFADSVERRLRQSRFLILIIGDGIQEGVEALTNHLQLHAGLHVGLALVDLSVWRDTEGGLLVVPRIPLRTLLVERGVVTIDASSAVQIQPPRGQSSERSPRAITASEPEFFAQLEQRRPGLAMKFRAFLEEVSDLGVVPEFRKTVVLRWQATPDFDASCGYITNGGRVWFDNVKSAAKKFGRADAAERYLEAVAKIVGGSIKGRGTDYLNVLSSNGTTVDVETLLGAREQWKAALVRLIEETRPEQ